MDIYILIKKNKVVYWTSQSSIAREWKTKDKANDFRLIPPIPLVPVFDWVKA